MGGQGQMNQSNQTGQGGQQQQGGQGGQGGQMGMGQGQAPPRPPQNLTFVDATKGNAPKDIQQAASQGGIGLKGTYNNTVAGGPVVWGKAEQGLPGQGEAPKGQKKDDGDSECMDRQMMVSVTPYNTTNSAATTLLVQMGTVSFDSSGSFASFLGISLVSFSAFLSLFAL